MSIDDNTEFCNSEKGIIYNHKRFLISKEATVQNDGKILSSKNIPYDDKIIGNTPTYSIAEISKQDVNLLINKEIKKYQG